jgi:hypothetical protein
MYSENTFMLQETCKYCLLDYLKDVSPSDTNTKTLFKEENYIYHINKRGELPFLQFYFPKKQTMESPLCERKGMLVENYCIYSFYEITREEIKNIQDSWTPFTVDEIVNKRKTDNKTRLFMLNHPYTMLLKDLKGKIIETPVISYKPRIKCKKLKSPYTFIMGPYYYFNVEERNDYRKVALFLGRVHVPMNFPKDDWDKSTIKSALLREDEKNKYIRQTMRISDHDGNWTNNYDSVYLGKLDLDDGKTLQDCNQWVVKNINQIVFLDE